MNHSHRVVRQRQPLVEIISESIQIQTVSREQLIIMDQAWCKGRDSASISKANKTSANRDMLEQYIYSEKILHTIIISRTMLLRLIVIQVKLGQKGQQDSQTPALDINPTHQAALIRGSHHMLQFRTLENKLRKA